MEQKQAIETLADQPLETQIDHLVYQLYNLTPDEISIVEGGRVAGSAPIPAAHHSRIKTDVPSCPEPETWPSPCDCITFIS